MLHPNPFYRYKRWNDLGWRGLARGLAERGLAVVATEGRDPAERAYIDGLVGRAPIRRSIRERGRLDWAGLAALLQGAEVYVGPDTSMTHLAAGSGCPTVALYGPTSPRLIGPWPVGGLAEPWDHAGTIQRRGNVWVVQNPLPCLPCEKLGCEGHLDSRSQCLDELSAARGAGGGRSGAAQRSTHPTESIVAHVDGFFRERIRAAYRSPCGTDRSRCRRAQSMILLPWMKMA